MKGNMTAKSRTGYLFSLPLLLALSLWMLCIPAKAATALNEPLDPNDPVYFYGETITYQNQAITLNDKNIYIDGSLSDDVCNSHPYVYNDFKKAYESGAIKSGTKEVPMNVYLAPYVYWIDDPNDPEIREGVNGDKVPYGLWMNCDYLSLNGLTKNPDNVVLAVNRGQNAGAHGNFTMFYINGTGTHTENLTMGNYCCVDLEYPLKPELSREKRQDAITQSQLVLTNGSKITAENCNFISRLNSCPFVGGSRILFQDCHFECTDDSLPTSAVYVNCDFEFYSSKPFYSTTGTGSVMLGCDFYLMHGSSQYLTKTGGVVTIIDGTFYLNQKDQYVGWTPDPSTSLRCYQANIKTVYRYTDDNGTSQEEVKENYLIDADAPYDSVDLTDKEALTAYRLPYNTDPGNSNSGSANASSANIKSASVNASSANSKSASANASSANSISVSANNSTGSGSADSALTGGSLEKNAPDSNSSRYLNVKYNIYNLLKGSDGWDPLNQKETLENLNSLSSLSGTDYTDVPVMLSCSPLVSTVSNGKSLKISTSIRGFSSETSKTETITWSVEDSLKDYITLTDNGDGSCSVTCKNKSLYSAFGMIYAQSSSGLSSGTYLTAAPETQPAPEFTTSPYFSNPSDGVLSLQYQLPKDDILDDYSEILWYRCSDKEGKEAVLVSTSPKNTPLKSYSLSYGDVGYYIKAVISPAQLNTRTGSPVTVMFDRTIALSDVTQSPFTYHTDFTDFACLRQPVTIPGFFTRDVYQAWSATEEERSSDADGWSRGEGVVGYGDEGLYGLLPMQRGARLMYTPTAGTYGDMDLTLTVNPEKNAGQGFGSAGQYMDVYIKFDPSTLTGYALRLERIANLDCGVQASLVKYENGTVSYLTDGVKTSAFNAECTITLSVSKNKLTAGMVSTHEQSEKQAAAGLSHQVSLEADITENNFGGMGIYFTGTTPSGNRVMLNDLEVNWDEESASLSEPVAVSLKEAAGSDSDENDASEAVKQKKGTTFSKGGISYRITDNKINGKGCVSVIKVKNSKKITIKNKIAYQGVSYRITNIGKNAFSQCKKLKQLTLGTSIKTVGKNAMAPLAKNCVIQVPAKKIGFYKKLLRKKGLKKTVTIVKPAS